MIPVVAIVLHCLELIKLQPAQKVLYQILQIFPPVAEEITQSADQVKMRIISQSIKGISRVLQKLLKYFNNNAILTPFVLPSAGVFPVFFFVKISFGSSL